MSRIFALVDCNSFYCSCERLFRPDLRNQPVGVLSNNDGCFVSLTKELKALGVKMGEPYFKVKDFCKKNNVTVFSSNFSLYTNLSDRVMITLSEFTPELEIYSVDEAFLDLSGFESRGLENYARLIKNTVEKHTGIPVSIGLGSTKTIAKLANYMAKKIDHFQGVCSLLDPSKHDAAMQSFSVEDIWGIGRQKTKKLHELGIKTALQLRDYKNDALIQKLFTKVGRMTQDELRGIACFKLNQEIIKKKEIMCSRTFGHSTNSLEHLQEAVAGFASNVCEKLRAQKSVCSAVEVWIRTNPFNNSKQHFDFKKYSFQSDTMDTRKVIGFAFNVLDQMYKHGYEYKKAAVRLTDLRDSNQSRLSLFDHNDSEKTEKLMQIIDKINTKEGPETLKFAACGTQGRSWKMNQAHKSKRIVSGWSELPKVY